MKTNHIELMGVGFVLVSYNQIVDGFLKIKMICFIGHKFNFECTRISCLGEHFYYIQIKVKMIHKENTCNLFIQKRKRNLNLKFDMMFNGTTPKNLDNGKSQQDYLILRFLILLFKNATHFNKSTTREMQNYAEHDCQTRRGI